jgi:hypothetical protein
MINEPSIMAQPYEVVSISRATTPEGGQGADWYDYEIALGNHTINGCRQGSLKSVTSDVNEIVIQMNERRFGKRGRVNLVPTPKKTAATK